MCVGGAIFPDVSSERWNPDGVTPWRSARPPTLAKLYVAASPDSSVADTIALSGSLPVSAAFHVPTEPPVRPYLLVEPQGGDAKRPATSVVVSLFLPNGQAIESRQLTWNPEGYDERVELGRVITELATKAAR